VYPKRISKNVTLVCFILAVDVAIFRTETWQKNNLSHFENYFVAVSLQQKTIGNSATFYISSKLCFCCKGTIRFRFPKISSLLFFNANINVSIGYCIRDCQHTADYVIISCFAKTFISLCWYCFIYSAYVWA